MMAGLSVQAWARLGIWTVIGGLIYFFYGYHHSKLREPIEGEEPRQGK